VNSLVHLFHVITLQQPRSRRLTVLAGTPPGERGDLTRGRKLRRRV